MGDFDFQTVESVISPEEAANFLARLKNKFLAGDSFSLKVTQQNFLPEEMEKFLQDLRVLGFVLEAQKTLSGSTIFKFKRPNYYAEVERERVRLGIWGQDPSAPRYSVCVCNYNMSDTLDRAMSSVADQLDPRLYEILVIDDGSNDDSLAVLDMLARKYPNFRYISLPRDPRRKLGETRNISIRAARGEYVLIHIDADDVWEPFLHDLVLLYHKLEQAAGHDFLLAAQQTGIAKRDFLLSYGPYTNIYRCEDRNMMMRLAKKDLIKFMDYRVYRTRLSRPPKKKLIKVLRDTCSSMLFEFRQNEKDPGHIMRTLRAPIMGGQGSFNLRLLRAIFVLPMFVLSKLYSPVINDMTWQELRDYHTNHRGTYSELMNRMGHDPDISFLSRESQEIYSYNVRVPGFQSAG